MATINVFCMLQSGIVLNVKDWTGNAHLNASVTIAFGVNVVDSTLWTNWLATNPAPTLLGVVIPT